MQERPETSFAATLTPQERRLASRLEGFGDIVFGFAIAQCALQLPTSDGHVDLLRGFGVLLYFVTFALIASLWLAFHRLMSGTFVPSGVDLVGAFAYLALVSLFPFAMYATTHTKTDRPLARNAFAEYAILYATMMALAAIITFRNLRRGWHHSSAEERDRAWVTFVRRCIVGVEMALATGIDFVAGPTVGALFLCSLPIAVRVSRARFAHAPQRFAGTPKRREP